MLKKLAFIGMLTGLGQLFSLFTLRYLSQKSSTSELALFGQSDSIVQFLINLIAFGLQADAMRNIALEKDWQHIYTSVQRARMTLGLFLLLFLPVVFIEPAFIVFAITPLLALNADYALYASGKAVTGAAIALLRLLFPFGAVAIAAGTQIADITLTYTAALFVVYTVTNIFISYHLKVPFWVKPSLNSMRLYIENFPLGLVTVALYFIGFGLLTAAPYFYSAPQTATLFVVLKLYLIYKGILRITHQAFLSKMMQDTVCLKLDELSVLFALIFAGTLFIFPDSMIRLLFGEEYLTEVMLLKVIAAAAIVYAVYLSASTKVMLLKKDKSYAFITVRAALVTVGLSVAFSFFWKSATAAGISIFIGEVLWLAGLISLSDDKKGFLKRLNFAGRHLPLLIIPYATMKFAGDNTAACIVSFGVVATIMFIANYQSFKTAI